MSIKSLVSALVFGGIGTCAMAGPYLDIAGAYTLNGDQNAQNNATGTTGHLTLDDGYAAHLAGGWDFGSQGPVGVRAELELGYGVADYDVATITKSGVATSAAQTGRVTNTSVMANGFADIPLTKNGQLEWYVGLGVGVAFLSTDPILSSTGAVQVRGWDEPVLAGQAMTGLVYHFDNNWALHGGYRYYRTQNVTVNQLHYDGNEVHAFELGLRYSF